MEVVLQKWGNSNGIRIPSSVIKELDLKTGDKIELKNDGEIITLSKRAKKNILLEEKFNKYKGPNLAKEFKWDEAVGKEIW